MAFGCALLAGCSRDPDPKPRREIAADEVVLSLAFSPDRRVLASGGGRREVRLWDPSSGLLAASLPGHKTEVSAMAFSPDGAALASGEWEDSQIGGAFGGDVRLWDVQTRRLTATLSGHSLRVYGVAFSPDGKVLASVGDEATKLWDPRTGECTRTIAGGGGSLAYRPDGKALAVGGTTSVRVVAVADGAAAPLRPDVNFAYSLAYSPDGRTLAAGCGDGAIMLWDAATGEATVLRGHRGTARAVAFGPDGRTLASAGYDDFTVRLWDLPSGQPLATFRGHTAPVNCVAISPDGRIVASAGRDKVIRLWDVSAGRPADL